MAYIRHSLVERGQAGTVREEPSIAHDRRTGRVCRATASASHRQRLVIMKILVLADIHANWPALAAIAAKETFDACLFAGDLVDYGTDPVPCVEWIREHARAAVRGNHDHAVAQKVSARGGTGFRQLAAITRPLQWAVLQPTHAVSGVVDEK